MRSNCGRWFAAAAEFLILTAVVGFLGQVLVRSHWTSIWMDREFTGWVAPVANRLADGTRLYGPEAHLPMPPLPFLLTYAVAPGRATWLTESALNVGCQSLLVLAMYLGLAWRLPRPIPLVASLLAAPVYFALPKTILYDSSTQLLVALTAITAALASAWRSRASEGGGLRRVGALAPVALLTATTLFSKQSTGVGLVLGVAVLLTLGAPSRRRAARAGDVALFVLMSVLFLVGLAVACRDFLSVRGMFHDVFLVGSEPKGGFKGLLTNTIRYFRSILEVLSIFVINGVVFAALLAKRRGGGPGPVAPPPAEPVALTPAATALAYALVVAAPLALGIFETPLAHRFKIVAHLLATARFAVLWAGLIFVAALYTRRLWRGEPRGDTLAWLAALTPVLVLPAFFHSMSTPDFRWFYDNNPLITLALAGFLFGLAALLLPSGKRPGVRASALYLTMVFFVSCALWGGFAKQYVAARSCTEEWTEVPHLRGARMTKTAEGMRRLVAAVRQAAPDAAADEVLLLPNDPNVEAWFARRRPRLSGAIVFCDQYWDRYVDEDFQRLADDPPRVIVIGPRNSWRTFGPRAWRKDRGSNRLITRVETRLLPTRYVLKTAQPIQIQDDEDFMDVYVRRDDGPVSSAPGTTTRR